MRRPNIKIDSPVLSHMTLSSTLVTPTERLLAGIVTSSVSFLELYPRRQYKHKFFIPHVFQPTSFYALSPDSSFFSFFNSQLSKIFQKIQ